jgi:hypothetical protein
MNPASEATLAELLAVNKQMAGAISQLAAKGAGGGAQPAGGGGGGGSSGGPGVFSKGLDLMGGAVKGVTGLIGGGLMGALGLAKAGFGQVAETGRAVYQAQKALATETIHGTGTLSSFSDQLGNLPGILGMIATAYSYQQKILQKNLETYQQISSVGATFGGSLTEVRNTAKGMGLSMDEFAQVMKQNGPMLARMGSSAADGAKFLAKFNTDLIKGELGRGILGLGYSLTEANNLLGTYASIQGGLSQAQLKDQAQLTQHVAMFADEMDRSAQLEGKSRQAKEEEMKVASQNAAVQAKLASMTPDQQAKYKLAMSEALRTAGQAGAQALNSSLLGLPPMTKAAQMLQATMPKANQSILDNVKIVKDNSKATEAQAQIQTNGRKGQLEAAAAVKRLGDTTVAAISMSENGSALQGVVNEGLKTSTLLQNQGIKTEADAQKQDQQISKEQADRKKSEAGPAAQALARSKYQAGLMDKINAILARFFPIVVSVVEAFMNIFEWSINMGSKILDKVLIPAFKEIFGGIKAADLMKPFKDFWKGLTGGFTSGDIDFTKVKDTIVAFVKPIVDTFGALVKSVNFEDLGKYLRTFFIGIKDFATGVFGSFKSVDTGSIVVFFKSFFSGLSQMYGLLAESIGRIDFKGIGEGLGRALKTVFDAIRDIFQPVFDKAGPIFSQIGSELGPVFNDIADIINIVATAIADSIGAIVKIISNILVPVLKPIISGLMDAVLPFWEAVKNFIKIVKALLQGDFKSLPQLFSNMWKGIIDAFKELISGIWEGVKTLFSPSKWFDGVGDKKAETKTQATPNTQAAASQNQGAIDKLANDWAYGVYSGKNTLAQVPKDALAKVQDILKNPPGNWKAEVNKTQQQNATAPKTETQTAQNTAKTAEKKEEKVAATPAVDLNNKDALVVLKTLADYQRRTIDAVNNLNGNILKRA